ncbi:hypothetical protein MHH60_20425 [Paenibacillus sp. FSL H7-0716]|uniref:PD-(D/E)XK endonuclease-like domain-containing protein n=1 Tax=Paenibacillus odorifer TaxID=189426 RepID=A0AB36JCZ6_9BACL|nr:hypothetical protein [Paenibacillus odorifer]OME16571.1 hypothetical protein BSK47_20140 [Paenibacillus odorifer]
MHYLCTYDNSRPADEIIQRELIAGRPYIYVTATKAMANERRALIPEHQKSELERKPSALFGDFIRNELRQANWRFATRGEEKTFLKRAFKTVASGSPLLLDLFHKDSASFLRVLYDLSVQGIDLRNMDLPKEKLEQLVNPQLGDYLVDIHRAFHDGLEGVGLSLFDGSGRDFLLRQFTPKPVVIMEGFTFLTEMQHLFIQNCIKNKIDLYFIVPMHDPQINGFEVIQNTYKLIPDLMRKPLSTPHISEREDLHHLQKHLFSDNSSAYTENVSNITMQRYPNRDREMQACIEQLRNWFEAGTFKPNEVAVVMRRSKEFLDRFRDHLAMNPLIYYPEGSDKPVEVTLLFPPRLLLLTPVGRFVLTLYRIWEDGHLRLSMEEMETVLASGWLGARLQDSTTLFRAVKHQFFSKCETRQQWEAVLDRLVENSGSDYERLPLHLLDHRTITRWKEVVALLENVCARLFVTGQKRIADHIRLLQAELIKLLPKRLRRAEQEVLEQIQEVFKGLSEYYSIEITSDEFGEALHAMTRGTTEEKDEEEEDNYDQDHILRVVTPETLDGLNKAAVMYVAVDSQHTPALYSEPWPFYEDKREEHVMKERYMFLTVVRAAQNLLWLSYSLKDGERSYQKSTYLGEIERLMNKQVSVRTILDQIDITLAKVPPIFPSAPAARRRNYELNELAHYGLCPLRYRLELLHPEARVYRSAWQLNIVAQGIWLDKIYDELVKYSGVWPNPLRVSSEDEKIEQLYRFLIQAKERVKNQVQETFPTFEATTWIAIERQVENQLKFHAKIRGKFTTRIFAGNREEIDILLPNDDNVIVSFNVPYYLNAYKITVPLMDYDLCHEWLLPGELRKEEVQTPNERRQSKLIEVGGINVFETQYHAVSWWRRTIQAHVFEQFDTVNNDVTRGLRMHQQASEEQLGQWITSIEQNHFPKHAGEHCTTCPVRMECLGIREEE